MSPDPLGGDITDPQSLNRYAYVRNNPLNFIDPSGMDCIGANGEPDDLLGDPSECDSGGGTWDNTVYCDWSGVYGCDTGPGFGGIEVGGVAQAGPPPSPVGSQPFPDGSMDETDGIPNWLGGSTGSVGLGCTYGQGSCGGMIYGFGAGNGSPQWSSYPAYLDWLSNALTLAGSILISPIGHCYGGDAICIPGQRPQAAANIQSDNATNFAAAGAVEAIGESGIFDAFQGINDNPLFRVGPGYKEMPDGTVGRIWRFASGGRWGKGGFKLPWHWHWP